MPTDSWSSATAILRLTSELIDGIQHGVIEQGFDDVRPMHGFAFARLSDSPATTVQLSQYLGVTKQAAGELVSYLVDRDYLARAPDPTDRRASLLLLTERGHACTRAAQNAAEQAVRTLEARIPQRERAGFRRALAAMAVPGRVRPSW